MVRPSVWWMCPSCSSANDADLERCCACGCPRSRLCEVRGCGRARDESGLCDTHRSRFSRWGVSAQAPDPGNSLLAGSPPPRSYSRPPDSVPAVLARPTGSGGHSAGQALVEMALVLPLILLIFLGALDGGRLLIQKADQDRRTATIATWAASRPGDESWHAIAESELHGCTVTLDDTGRPGIVHVGAVCTFEPIGLHGVWDGLLISSEASAVVLTPEPSPTPSSSPSPEPTPTPTPTP